jgi:hypothetical protein
MVATIDTYKTELPAQPAQSMANHLLQIAGKNPKIVSCRGQDELAF